MITVLSASAARNGTERNHMAARFTQRPTAIINNRAFVVRSVMIALLSALEAHPGGNVTAEVDRDSRPADEQADAKMVGSYIVEAYGDTSNFQHDGVSGSHLPRQSLADRR